ncbi:hypothetical protein TEA_024229 [Camellia sinensis var. sinensis]|uniref:Vacuolar protein 14 C-terminal Fig4-binding domain-containing protein n=1 Tax=Camellia sinensis var. sinensis TaxID=542762 RepID=A0A4V3WM87_CAMSN|nr:hypothetical protein TEA_024229 [Camellia sinensis var. sinensis]
MADALSVIPPAVLRNLSDKLYEKRKNAALEIEGIVKQLAAAGEHNKITAVINLLANEFTYSAQVNHRKGGLIGLAAATVALTGEAAQHLEQIVPPVLSSFSDQDSRVRYYACEALYNIAKVVRGDFIVFFNKIFDALCKLSADSDPNVQSAAHLLDKLVKDIVTDCDQFSIEEFIPLLRERMHVLNPYVRQFLVGWITVLDGAPEIDMLGFLPDFLDGLFNMLSDSSHEIRQQADSALSEFLQEIKNSPSVDYGRMTEIVVRRAASPDEFTRLTAITWINEFVKLGGDQLVPYYADILGAILPCISDKEEKIRVVAHETNEELRAIKADPAEGFNVEAILSIARRQLSSEYEATRIEALHWIMTLLNRHRAEVLSFLNNTIDTLLKALSDPSDEVVLLVLEVHACIAKEPQHFHQLVGFLVHNFGVDNTLLEKRGALIIRRLCVLLDAERVYRELSTILERESELDFASIMVQALNLILLTSSELSELRDLLKQSLAYQHASSIIQSLVEEDFNVEFLVQLDKLIHLLETPIFAYLRLQLAATYLLSYSIPTTISLLDERNEKLKQCNGRIDEFASHPSAEVDVQGGGLGEHIRTVNFCSGLLSQQEYGASSPTTELLEPGRYIWLLKSLYGLLMLLPQQSKAFKILRTRLKAVPSYSFNGEQFKQTSSGNSYSQINHRPSGSFSEDGDIDENLQSVHNGINFASWLQQFEQMQQKHRMHSKSQTQLRYSSYASTQEVQRAEEPRRPLPVPDMSGLKIIT